MVFSLIGLGLRVGDDEVAIVRIPIEVRLELVHALIQAAALDRSAAPGRNACRQAQTAAGIAIAFERRCRDIDVVIGGFHSLSFEMVS